MRDNEVIEQVKTGDDKTLEKVYIKYRQEFISWSIKRYACSVEEATDVYQQVIITFYDNCVQGKLCELKSNLKTYLFAIGKNKLMEEKKHKVKFINQEQFDLERDDTTNVIDEREESLLMVEKSLKKIGEHCKQLLEMFYYQKKSIEDITVVLGYKNKASARNQKYKCMEKLRKIHQEQFSNTYE